MEIYVSLTEPAAGPHSQKEVPLGLLQEDGRCKEELCSPQADEGNVIANFSTLCKSDKREDIFRTISGCIASIRLLDLQYLDGHCIFSTLYGD